MHMVVTTDWGLAHSHHPIHACLLPAHKSHVASPVDGAARTSAAGSGGQGGGAVLRGFEEMDPRGCCCCSTLLHRRLMRANQG
jgi:hypothetical protein